VHTARGHQPHPDLATRLVTACSTTAPVLADASPRPSTPLHHGSTGSTCSRPCTLTKPPSLSPSSSPGHHESWPHVSKAGALSRPCILRIAARRAGWRPEIRARGRNGHSSGVAVRRHVSARRPWGSPACSMLLGASSARRGPAVVPDVTPASSTHARLPHSLERRPGRGHALTRAQKGVGGGRRAVGSRVGYW
jgi:hypothetical protein